MNGSNGSIDPHHAGSLSITDEVSDSLRMSGCRHWKEIKPGMLIHVTRTAAISIDSFEPVLVLVLTSATDWSQSYKRTIMTRMAGGCLTANEGWVAALEGGMHFFPVLYQNQPATLCVWAHDDGWEPL